jgi:hypothetical protein
MSKKRQMETFAKGNSLFAQTTIFAFFHSCLIESVTREKQERYKFSWELYVANAMSDN